MNEKFCHVCGDYIPDGDVFWVTKIEVVSPLLERKTVVKYVCTAADCQGEQRFWLWQNTESDKFYEQ